MKKKEKLDTIRKASEIFDFIGSYESIKITREGISSGQVAFGNPCSKLTELEQLSIWEKMIQQEPFLDRDEFCNTMARYSSFEQAAQDLGFPDLLHQG